MRLGNVCINSVGHVCAKSSCSLMVMIPGLVCIGSGCHDG